MSYAAIDTALDHWAVNHKLSFSKHSGSSEARFVYFSRGDFCCQISLDPPADHHVVVHLWSIEVWEHEDFEYLWTVSVDEVTAALDAAFAQGCEWMTSHTTKMR